ncbi:MAG: hypothetical protein JRG96_13945 [Deltaproteobacteria bacterium]|nr:hypothetical protein [Deltaproteobacteria bacterium]
MSSELAQAHARGVVRLLACLGLGLALGLAPLACSREASLGSVGGGQDESDRWARRFVPFEESWCGASEIPSAPQDAPHMVIWELSEYEPGTPPTPEQKAAGEAFLEACYRAALERGWYDFDAGLADGYRLLFQDRRHYVNDEYVLDGRILDPERPEFLMYYGTPRGKRLAGFMFYVNEPGERGPQFAGNDSLWHYHIWKRAKCLLHGLIAVGEADADGNCERGTVTHRSPEMLHVWLLDLPTGSFSTSMMISPAILGEAITKRDAERPETVTPAP